MHVCLADLAGCQEQNTNCCILKQIFWAINFALQCTSSDDHHHYVMIVQCPGAGSTVMWKSWNSRASNSKCARTRFPQPDRQISAGRSPDFVQQIDCRISGIVLRDWWTVSHYRIIIIIIHNYLKSSSSSSWSQYAFSCHMAWYMRDPRRCLRIRS